MANLYKMYKGLEGSPTSKIVQGISVSATTIVVQDPSVLPAAPNFACLFDDTGKIEVVEYTQKSGQTLTCIRGVSGQRLEWPIATSIARNFTSIDYNNLVDNVSMMNVELNELTLEYGYIFDSVVQGDFVQQVLQMAEQVEALNGEVNTMLDNLTMLEEQLQQAEQTRQTNETARQTAEGQRSSAESGRVTAEQNRVSSESGRAAAEQTRQSNEQTRQNNETTRATAESGRVTAESSRVTAEQGRVNTESSRVLVEQGRSTAESGRVTAEQTREQKETTRQTNETARQAAESSRASAESQRDNNETSRQTNEGQRQTSEGQRNSAESLRVTSESSRAVAESSRVSAESARETAESTRVSNETNRQAQLTDAINAASVSAQQAQGFRDSAYSHAQYSESMKDQSASYAIDAEAAAVRAEYVATSLGGIQDWALQPTKPTYTYSEVGAAAATHSHIVSDILDFPTTMPASDVYPWAKDESKPIYTAAEIGASEIGHVHDYAPSIHNHIVADIIDFPTSMPASDVSAWAKADIKPAYTSSEVGAAPAAHDHDSSYLGKTEKAADSDKLDGYHASDFSPIIHTHPFSNPNILHNAGFRAPINQRGVSGSISTGTYFFDRWIRNSGTVTVAAGYLTLASGAVIEQRIEGLYLAGETVTVSVRVGSTIYNGTGVFPTSAGTAAVTLTGFGTATLGYNAGYMFVRFTASGSQNVVAVKCELGTASTLHLDPPMERITELLKCQWFYRRVGTGSDPGTQAYFYGRSGFDAAGQFVLTIPGPQMRINPTFTRDNVFMIVYNGAYYSATVTSVTSNAYGIVLMGTCPTSLPKLMAITAWANNIVELSADL